MIQRGYYLCKCLWCEHARRDKAIQGPQCELHRGWEESVAVVLLGLG